MLDIIINLELVEECMLVTFKYYSVWRTWASKDFGICEGPGTTPLDPDRKL